MQIEQFIETLFPTQDAKKIQALEEAKKEQKEATADFWDALMLVGSVVLALLLVSGTMVCDPLNFFNGLSFY